MELQCGEQTDDPVRNRGARHGKAMMFGQRMFGQAIQPADDALDLSRLNQAAQHLAMDARRRQIARRYPAAAARKLQCLLTIGGRGMCRMVDGYVHLSTFRHITCPRPHHASRTPRSTSDGASERVSRGNASSKRFGRQAWVEPDERLAQPSLPDRVAVPEVCPPDTRLADRDLRTGERGVAQGRDPAEGGFLDDGFR